MSRPYVTIDLEKIEHNARAIVRLCARHGIEVTGVTKVTCGMPQVARAMLRGGVTAVGESRMENIMRLKANGVNTPYMLLRIPPLSAVEDIVTSADMSLNSELSVIAALSEAAYRRGLVHKIIIMVDLGDLREGVLPEDLMPLVREVVELPGVRIIGLGTNLSCYGGVLPSEENMGRLMEHARQVEEAFGLKLRYISGGNSSSLKLIAAGRMPAGVNHVRIGEGILLGRETIDREPWPGTHQDAFMLNAEVIELKEKPSVPIGETGQDAFGQRRTFEDKGNRHRAILNIGREDVVVEGIRPVDTRLSILGASSDHLLVDVTAAEGEIHLGDDLPFALGYGALLAAMTSMYIEKQPLRQGDLEPVRKGVVLVQASPDSGDDHAAGAMLSMLSSGFENLGLAVSRRESSNSNGAVADAGDTSLSVFEREKHQVLQHAAGLAEPVRAALSEDYLPVVLGAGAVDSLGVYLGVARYSGEFGLIVFSAFGGLLTPEAGGDAAVERMVLAAALGHGDGELAACGGLVPKFEAENVALIGLREVASQEARWITSSRLKVFTMEDIDALGMREVTHRALRAAGMGTAGIHVTLDLSVLDPTVAPAVMRPVRGGISYREAHLAMEMIANAGLLRSLDIFGLQPVKDRGAQTARVASEFVFSLLGKKILGR